MVKEAEVPSTAQTPSQNRTEPAQRPGNLAVKCPKCKEMLIGRDWEKNLRVCSRCSYHFKLSAYERIELLVDPDSFVEMDSDIISVDPLNFVSSSQAYATRLDEERESISLNEAVVSGHATIENLLLVKRLRAPSSWALKNMYPSSSPRLLVVRVCKRVCTRLCRWRRPRLHSLN
jgi:acetyl-CoA carboxylase carboxyl transferase subunit beta